MWSMAVGMRSIRVAPQRVVPLVRHPPPGASADCRWIASHRRAMSSASTARVRGTGQAGWTRAAPWTRDCDAAATDVRGSCAPRSSVKIRTLIDCTPSGCLAMRCDGPSRVVRGEVCIVTVVPARGRRILNKCRKQATSALPKLCG